MKTVNYLFLFLSICKVNLTFAQLFTQISPTQSGVYFNNIITENKDFNIFLYGYLYNGGGVAVGDINNDGLPDLYFSGNMVSNKLYLNLGNLKFKDITDSAGVQCDEGYKTGVSFADVNQDGFTDIYVCKSAVGDPNQRKNVLYINNGNLTFTEKAKEYGIDDAGYSTQAYFYDMDVDGDLDLFVLNHPPDMNYANQIKIGYNAQGEIVAYDDTARTYVSNRYYENNNNHFTDKTLSAGLGTHAFGLSAIVADFNEDGYPDIYTCNDFRLPDYLFINNKNGTFTNKAKDYFNHFAFSSMGSDYADINNDGLQDLIVVDMLPESFERQKLLRNMGNYDDFKWRVEYGFGYQYPKNVLQLNNGNQSYSDISYLSGIAFTEWSWAPIFADFDNDGFKDIYISNGYLRDITNMDFMMYDGDSLRKDLFKSTSKDEAMKILGGIPSNKMVNYFYRNNGNLTFDNVTRKAGINVPSFSNGAVYADLDSDGDLDLITNNIYEEPFIFKNNTSDNKFGNYLRFKLKGGDKNKEGLGATVQLETPDGKKQFQHVMPNRGFLSSHEQVVHFGIGKNTKATVTVTWQNKLVQQLSDLEVNKVYTLSIVGAQTDTAKNKEAKVSYFKDITTKTKINYSQKDNYFIDFKSEPLLPHQFSQMGPCIAVADVNGDGRDDFFVGGSKDIKGSVFKQDQKGTFSEIDVAAFVNDKKFEDTGARFFDADNDGDQDLLVASGGNEFRDNSSMYPLRLYINNGKGHFAPAPNFPLINCSGKAIATDDFDKDGWIDVFVGGRVVPGHYGLVPQSFLLKNNKGNFENIGQLNENLTSAGMVTDAVWCDVDKDSWKDLVLVGEWMPLTIFKNNKGTLEKKPVVFENSYGWWNTIYPCDYDKDGDIDLIGGNISANTRYRGNELYPITMVVSDFDENGSTDCVISMFQEGVSYPVPLRDNMLDQMTVLKKKFLRYKDYSTAKVNDIFTEEQLSKAINYKANNIANTLFINDSTGNFSSQLLSVRSQFFPVQAVVSTDVDKDGNADILLAGNDYSTEVETGRNDAGIGLMLKYLGGGKFKTLSYVQSGFYVPGDVKCMLPITIGNKSCLIVGKNQGDIQVIEINPEEKK